MHVRAVPCCAGETASLPCQTHTCATSWIFPLFHPCHAVYFCLGISWGLHRLVRNLFLYLVSLSLPEQHTWLLLHPAAVGCTEFGWFPICRSLGLPHMSKVLLIELVYICFLQLFWWFFSDVEFPIKIPSPSVLILPAKDIFYGCTLICCLGYPWAASLGKLIFREAIFFRKKKISSGNQQLIWISPAHMRLPQSTHVLYLPFSSLPIKFRNWAGFFRSLPTCPTAGPFCTALFSAALLVKHPQPLPDLYERHSLLFLLTPHFRFRYLPVMEINRG